MLGIAFILLAVVSLGLAFFTVAQSTQPAVKRRGPWLIGVVAWCVSTIALETYDDGLGVLFRLRPHEVKELLIGACVVAGLAIEAVLISRLTLARFPSRIRYLVAFSCVTLFAWFATCIALLDVIPGS